MSDNKIDHGAEAQRLWGAGVSSRERDTDLISDWAESFRADPEVVPMADRHYNRQKIGSPQFVPPGRCHVLKIGTAEQLRTPDSGGAFWVTSWPFAEYTKHAWAGAWVCSAFRNEGAGQASDLIRAAVLSTALKWPEVPELGMVSFIDPSKVAPRPIRGRKTWGHSWFEAGFKHVGYTKGGLWVMQMDQSDIRAMMRMDQLVRRTNE